MGGFEFSSPYYLKNIYNCSVAKCKSLRKSIILEISGVFRRQREDAKDAEYRRESINL
jgi:hypothetical protein